MANLELRTDSDDKQIEMESEVQGSLTPSQQRFVTLLGSSWFPPHPEVLARVRDRVRDDNAIRDRDALERELWRDPSLYLRAIRELSVRASKESGREGAGATTSARGTHLPAELIRLASKEALREVLDVPPDRCSAVPFHGASDWAAKRTAQALCGCITAEALAAPAGLPKGLGFAAGLFRQLGMLLIAWHHPHVYARIVESLPTGDSLDDAIAKVLGMSPATLGLSLAREWRICPEVRIAMGDDVAAESESARQVGLKLKGICEVGETLARGHFFKAANASLSEYKEASTRVQLAIGHEGLRAIFAEVDSVCEQLRRSFPSAFPGSGDRSTPQVRTLAPFSEQLPPFVREQLQFIRMNFEGGVAPEQLRSVVEQIIRSLGFSSGCLYLFDPGTQRLIPRVTWGELAMRAARSIDLTSTAEPPSLPHEAQREDLIRSAFALRKPTANGKALATFAVPIGSSASIGALALEMRREFFEPRKEIIAECVVSLGRAISEALEF